jgi:predicted outer membrane protein
MRWYQASLTAAVAMLVVSAAMAQNRNFDQQQQQQPQQQQGQFAEQGQPGMNLSDRQIATWLSVENHGEIAAAQLAEQHAHNQQVKDLAREMVKQHTDYGQQLTRFAGGMAAAGTSQPGANQTAGQPANQTLTSSTTNPSGAPTGQAGMNQGLNFVAVIQQIGQQCQQSLSRELGEAQGAEFDQCFVGQQIGAHRRMIDTLRVLRQYASPQLQQVLAQGEQTAQHHLDQYKQLLKTLEPKRS